MYVMVLAHEEDLLVQSAAHHHLAIDHFCREIYNTGLNLGDFLRPARQHETRLDAGLAGALAHQAIQLQKLGALIRHVLVPPSINDAWGPPAAPLSAGMWRTATGGPRRREISVSCWS